MFKTVFLTLLIAATVLADLPATTHKIERRRARCERQKPLICVVTPASNSGVSGTLIFKPVFQTFKRRPNCFVRILAVVNGLNGRRHGIHIHEYGDISNSTGASTGDHFDNPQGIDVDHGFPNDAIRHWGDFGNLVVRPNGVAVYNRVDRVISIPGIIGRGITIHENRDRGADFQPTGDAGGRIGFCVIGIANPASIKTFLDSFP